jgi:flavin reductase (DIM6/NTAB) family NADH-FMN oxidoreductase RutF
MKIDTVPALTAVCAAAASEIGSPPRVGAAEFRAAMRHMGASVTVVTAGQGAKRRGMTATAVCSLSAEPPALIACVNKQSACHDAVLRSGAFAVNLLASAAGHEHLAERFAGQHGVHGPARFRDDEWMELATGAPVLRAAAVAFDCMLHDALDGGTHSILIGHVVATRSDPDRVTLLYRAGAYSTSPRTPAA